MRQLVNEPISQLANEMLKKPGKEKREKREETQLHDSRTKRINNKNAQIKKQRT